jgi:DNA-binding Xre family transcriptional regulator
MARLAKLTVHQLQDAQKALADRKASQADLARRFNVSQSAMSKLAL